MLDEGKGLLPILPVSAAARELMDMGCRCVCVCMCPCVSLLSPYQLLHYCLYVSSFI